MQNSILVPLDGSPLSDEILPWIERLLLRKDSEVHLLRVFPPEPAATGRDLWEKLLHTGRPHLEKLRDSLVEKGANAFAHFRTGDAAEEILRCSRELTPSLVCMSTHGRSGVSRWIRGSVAERVLRRTCFPLLLAGPPAVREGHLRGEARFRKILVPLDGSEMSERIFPLVEEFARLYESEIILFHAAVPVASMTLYPEWGIDYPPSEATARLEPHERRLAKAGLKVRIRTHAGPPAGEILEAVRHEKADLVAMTTHGRSRLARWAYGSVAETVLRHCGCPLLVLRTVETGA